MEPLTALAAGFELFAQEAQRICAAAGPHYRAYATAGHSFAGPQNHKRPTYAVTVFDASTAHVGKACGDIVRQTSHELPTPEAALAELATLLGVTYPFPAVQRMTQEQKEEIIRLLNHAKITRPEKTRTLLAYVKWDEQRATQAIAKIRKTIEDREAQPLRQLATAA